MKLPNAERAYVPTAKLSQYLLAESHPVGGPKARFLGVVGFEPHDVDLLEQALLALARTREVTEVGASPHGTKYVVDGEILTPAGRRVGVRTVWMTEPAQENPRFVTLYPL